MKRLFPVMLLLLIAAGCGKEKIYKENLNGEWNVYKYLLHNVDRTVLFQGLYPNYKLTFTESGTFSEFYTNPDTVVNNGTYSFTDNDEKILLVHTAYNLVDTLLVPYEVKRKYTIFNLTRDHVQLRNDSSQLYLEKIIIE
ncbi:MAG: hypothetical protein KIS94_09025 [Chitinophagales bacterium]|nr:hypothetical protein [Chitinophagales bacterium]